MTLPSPGMIRVIARHELRLTLRNRWVLAYTLIFAVLATSVSFFGLATVEFTGFQGFERTTVSLLNLVLYVVPLSAMLMAVQSFLRDGGTPDQLFSEPITRGEIVIGKVVGLWTANLMATILGFGASGALIAHSVGFEGLPAFLALLGFTILVGAAFICLATLLTILARRTSRAYVAVAIVWFVAVLLYDLLVIGLSFLVPETTANRLAYFSAFFNPIDSARIGALISISGKEVFGRAGAMLVRSLGGEMQAIWALAGALVAWSALPLLASSASLNRQDI